PGTALGDDDAQDLKLERPVPGINELSISVTRSNWCSPKTLDHRLGRNRPTNRQALGIFVGQQIVFGKSSRRANLADVIRLSSINQGAVRKTIESERPLI